MIIGNELFVNNDLYPFDSLDNNIRKISFGTTFKNVPNLKNKNIKCIVFMNPNIKISKYILPDSLEELFFCSFFDGELDIIPDNVKILQLHRLMNKTLKNLPNKLKLFMTYDTAMCNIYPLSLLVIKTIFISKSTTNFAHVLQKLYITNTTSGNYIPKLKLPYGCVIYN